jgi:predicted helicase
MELAQELASRARSLQACAAKQLREEPAGGHLRSLFDAFCEALVQDLSERDFADTYAHTLTYGLLCARWEHGSTGERFTRASALRHMPATSPFLKRFFETALEVPRELELTGLLDDLSGLLDRVHLGLVFGDSPDPVIHFYELFLSEYDPEVRHSRGVFYTPDAVVSFMVRSVDEALRTALDLPLGLADATSWKDYSRAHQIPIPSGTNPDDAVVSILDPAAGTGTFLKSVILEIHRTMTGHWRAQGQSGSQIELLWDDYVVHQLVQRIHGLEVMVAPYAICHLKLALTLRQTGFRGPLPSMNVRLTNSLRDAAGARNFGPVLVVLGNPPYSGHSANLSDDSKRLVDRYRYIAGEKLKEKGALQLERNLQDDYVKFISLSQSILQPMDRCVWCFVTNHGFIDGPTLSGLRHALLQDFSVLKVMNLHGNVNRGEAPPDGGKDENVFPIKDAGVAITLGVRRSKTTSASECAVYSSDLWGLKADKLSYLAARTANDVAWKEARPRAMSYLLNELASTVGDEYARFWAMDTIVKEYSNGIVTARDGLVIDFDKRALLARIEKFATRGGTHKSVCEAFEVSLKKGWDVAAARSALRSSVKAREDWVFNCLYRPFDVVQLYYHPAVIQTMPSTSWHMAAADNVAILVPRTVKGGTFQHVMVTRHMSEAICLSSKTSVNGNCFPLWLYPGAKNQVLRSRGLRASPLPPGAPSPRIPNLSPAFMEALCGPGEAVLSPADVFHYIAAILHSRGYLERYAGLIGNGFPRIPVPRNPGLVVELAQTGRRLADCYDLRLEKPVGLTLRLIGAGTGKLARAEFDESRGCVWINDTQHLAPITRPEWEFRVGDYRALERWLSGGRAITRRGSALTPADVKHLALIVGAIRELRRLIHRTEQIIGEHGGWPGAFYRLA